MEETQNEKFRRIASSRTQRIIDTIKLLGNCSNTYVYAYTDEEIKKIFKAIESELEITKSRFKNEKNSNKNFEL